ncbi:MAG: transglutaminase domain-containing protein [Bacteroidetes bacterium]|nr:transglutaminase domain-containing protein [Bacteroidota bacterium]
MKRIVIVFFSIILFSSTISCQIINEGKYLNLLKNAKDYDLNEKNEDIEFTYQSKKDKNLKLLKNTYNLDSIAGKGNDISKVINLMRWIHNLIPWDGCKGIPDKRNAYNMIEVCKTENRTLNCRGLAITLNEVYLAMGYKSRYVTCMPKDSTDNDCHVINMVYIKSLHKWIWMDPTFEAYVMNEKGELLSIEEVRDRLINDKPMIINPDANWNHKHSQTIKRYLYSYMAKNLYRIECAIKSEYNYETKEEGKKREFIQLIPLDYKKYANIKHNHGIRGSIKTYYISDPLLFWEKP